MTTFFLLTALLAQTDDAVLTKSEYLKMNVPFEQLSEFKDNDFLWDEKLAEAEEGARQSIGRKVILDVSVSRVDKDTMSVRFTSNLEVKRGLPSMLFCNDSEANPETIDNRHESCIGRTGGSGSGSFDIGELLPLEVAKSLRQGDRLRISGVVRDARSVKTALFLKAYAAQLVVEVNKIDQLDDSDE